jgi:hypothetical protein
LAAELTLAEHLQRCAIPDAAAEFEAAADVGRRLQAVPTDRERASSRAECFRRLAKHDLTNDRPGDALAWLDRAVALIDRDPNWSTGAFRHSIEIGRASALNLLGRPAEAAAARATAEACRRRLPSPRPKQGAPIVSPAVVER